MIEKSKVIETKILAVIFFILLLAAIFLVAKASLTALGIYSSTTYSVAYFLLFGAGYIFTKYVYYSMFRIYKYVVLVIIKHVGVRSPPMTKVSINQWAADVLSKAS